MELKHLNPDILEKAAAMLKAMAHPVRIAIIGLLENGNKITVSDIHKQLGIGQSTVSHHLVILKDKGVLASKREGKNIYYFIKHNALNNILASVGECCLEL